MGCSAIGGSVDRTRRRDRKRPPAPASKTAGKKPADPRGNFRHRYDELEAKRVALMARLEMIGGKAQKHPGYKRVLTLLNDTFRKSKLAQRLAVLQAASWLIDVLERLSIGM